MALVKKYAVRKERPLADARWAGNGEGERARGLARKSTICLMGAFGFSVSMCFERRGPARA